MSQLIDKLKTENFLYDDEMLGLISCGEYDEELFRCARKAAQENYSNKIYVRGLIEISSFCKNNCFYCGIRCGNKNAQRYRLTPQQILSCCDEGYKTGFRTFVLQGGEDMGFSDEEVCKTVSEIKNRYPECAVTLSLGERKKETYKAFFESGADRYLLRHETANEEHYQKLHPQSMSLENRKECLFNLKEIGFQVGSGFMVGSPFQTDENLVEDLKFLKQLEPHMVGIGPFIPHCDTPFSSFPAGSAKKTLRLLAIIRLMFPKILLPATTALSTVDDTGREKGILAGANVVMPNLSPSDVREKYSLYDNKAHSGLESAQEVKRLNERFNKIGYEIDFSRGDSLI